MRFNQLVLCSGALAGAIAVVILTNQATVRDAKAQEAVPQNSPVLSDRTDKLRDRPGVAVRSSDRRLFDKKSCKASDIIGIDVRGLSNDDNIGSINDLMIQHNGKVGYAVVSFGGFLGVGDKLFAVPFEAIEFVTTSDDDKYARIDVTEETLKSRQGFDQDHWPKNADESFLRTGTARQRPALDSAVVPR